MLLNMRAGFLCGDYEIDFKSLLKTTEQIDEAAAEFY